MTYSNETAEALVPRLVVLSAHYNSQLGVLGALQLDTLLTPKQTAAVPWLTTASSQGAIPSAAAVLVFELHRAGPPVPASDPAAYAVRAVLQNGPAAKYTTVPLPCATAAAEALAGNGSCTLPDFRALIAPAIAASGAPAAWCAACGATAPLPCAASSKAAAPPSTAVGQLVCTKASGLGAGGVAAIVLGCLLFCVLLVALGAACANGYSSKRMRYEQGEGAREGGAKPGSGAGAAAAAGCEACLRKAGVVDDKAEAEEARELKNV